MSDKATTEVKDTQKVASPEKEAPEKKVEEAKETNGTEKETDGETKKNGVNKDEKSEEGKKPVENGESKEVESTAQKRKSDVGGGDATDNGSVAEGVSPEKKAKLEEKVENGEAEAATA